MRATQTIGHLTQNAVANASAIPTCIRYEWYCIGDGFAHFAHSSKQAIYLTVKIAAVTASTTVSRSFVNTSPYHTIPYIGLRYMYLLGTCCNVGYLLGTTPYHAIPYQQSHHTIPADTKSSGKLRPTVHLHVDVSATTVEIYTYSY